LGAACELSAAAASFVAAVAAPLQAKKSMAAQQSRERAHLKSVGRLMR
jgi:hypothetical protein